MRRLDLGRGVHRSARFSPDGGTIAFLHDRQSTGDFQLQCYDLASGAVRCLPPVDGWVEYLAWSPSGTQILLGVAGHGADVAGEQGAGGAKLVKRLIRG